MNIEITISTWEVIKKKPSWLKVYFGNFSGSTKLIALS
tara:strand:- start:368 stop:481 length:114 start_codon:yes stop_codon:yes gene_type:complete